MGDKVYWHNEHNQSFDNWAGASCSTFVDLVSKRSGKQISTSDWSVEVNSKKGLMAFCTFNPPDNHTLPKHRHPSNRQVCEPIKL